MTFDTQYEQELAEIKTVLDSIGRSFDDVAERLDRIQDVQGPTASGAVEGEGADPLIAFVHIPKTAGGTLTSMFAAAYSKAGIHKAGNFFRGPEKTLNKVTKRTGGWESWHRRGGRLSVGHVPYGLFREHLPRDTRYITFLREPVDRVLSHYYRHIHHPEAAAVPANQAEVVPAGTVKASSLEEALVEARLPQLNNFQTRFLSGDPAPTGVLPTTALEAAKANLRGFVFVGIQERFEESVALLQRTLGIGVVPYGQHRHVSIDRPSVDEIPDEQRELIEEHNRFDAELYAFGRELFEQAVAEAGDDLPAHVESLRAACKAMLAEEAEALRESCDWLGRELPIGGTRTFASLLEAAQAAGMSKSMLKRACEELGVVKTAGDGEEVLWTRTESGSADQTREPETATT